MDKQTKKNKMVRVRFAPSPTGYLHVGGLRTYLYNWLFAKKNKGKIILRIEDTDRQRLVEGATENLIKILKRIGLPWDEGPFIQSQRVGNYRNLAQKLVEQGHAYYCFCTTEELNEMKNKQIADKQAPQYDRRCRNLTQAEALEYLRAGKPHVIRLKVPERGIIKFNDLIRGQIEFDLKNIDDQVLLKSDDWPTYHLANVVDDHFMKITQVIRGEEWLPSTPKHILIYQAFGWEIPEFAHLPLLLNPDHSKLSKRQGDVAVEDYLGQGYLSKTLINFLALLGWNPGNDQEIFSLKQLTKKFSLKKIQKAGAIFDRKKLDWLNGYYLRQLPINKLTKICQPYLIESGLIKEKEYSFKKIKSIVKLEQERLKKAGEIKELTKFFFQKELEYDARLLAWKQNTLEQTGVNLRKIKEELQNISSNCFQVKKFIKKLNGLAKERGNGEIFWSLRVSLSGEKTSPPPEQIAKILGKEKTLKRIEQAIEKLRKIDDK